GKSACDSLRQDPPYPESDDSEDGQSILDTKAIEDMEHHGRPLHRPGDQGVEQVEAVERLVGRDAGCKLRLRVVIPRHGGASQDSCRLIHGANCFMSSAWRWIAASR